MKWLFNILLEKYSNTEEERREIHKTLQRKVNLNYMEQTVAGNIYNNQIEVVMSNDVICKLVKEGDEKNLEMIKRGLNKSFDEAIGYIESEELFPTEYE